MEPSDHAINLFFMSQRDNGLDIGIHSTACAATKKVREACVRDSPQPCWPLARAKPEESKHNEVAAEAAVAAARRVIFLDGVLVL